MDDEGALKMARGTGRNATILAFCFLAALVEGFDLQSASVAAPKFGPEFKLSPAQLGWVFSSNTFGLLIGALIGGWLADRVGRRWVLLTSMAMFGAFSLATAWSGNASTLAMMRFLTGLGLGGAMPIIIAMSAEAGRTETQATRATLISAGMPWGGSLSALLVLVAGPAMDWRTVFYVGGAFPLVLAALMLFWLPESDAFLTRDRGTTEKAPDRAPRQSTGGALFGEGRAVATWLLWLSFFCTLTVLYLLLNWLPLLLVGKGFTRPQATFVALLYAVGGGCGAFGLGYMLDRLARRAVLIVTYGGMAAALFALAVINQELLIAGAAGFLAGFFVIGGQYLLYGMSPGVYPSEVRATGVGAAVSVGRLGSVVGPALAGLMLSGGSGVAGVLLTVLPGVLIALVALMALEARRSTRDPGTEAKAQVA